MSNYYISRNILGSHREKEKEKEKARNQENITKVRWKRGKKEKEIMTERRMKVGRKAGREGGRKEGRKDGRKKERNIKIKTWNERRKSRLMYVT